MYLYSSRGAYSLIGTCAKKCNNTVSHSSTTSAPLPPAQVSDRCVTCQCYLCYRIMPHSPATRISHASAISATPQCPIHLPPVYHMSVLSLLPHNAPLTCHPYITCQCYLCYPIMPHSPATRISHVSAISATP